MTKPLKDSQVFAVIGICILVLFILISQAPEPEEIVSTIITPQIQPGMQVAQVSPTPATLTLSPSTNSVALNGTFTVNIVLNTGGQATYGVDINRLHYNPSLLQVVDADAATAGVQITPGVLMPVVFVNAADNIAGTVQFSQVANPGTTYTGSGTLASITFKAIAGGTSNVTFDFTLGSGTDSNVAGLGGDLLGGVGSGTYTGVAPDTTAPTAPGTPALTVSSATQIAMTWAASTDAVGVTGYRLERCSGSANCNTYTQIATPVTTSYTDTGLTASTIYRYRVRAIDAAGNLSTYSGASNATTLAPPDTTPPTISNIILSAITSSGATISWTTNEAADTQVEYGLTTAYGSNSALNSTLVTSPHSATISGLAPGTSYHYRVKSRDAAGNLSTSLDNVFTTTAGPDTTAPSIPTAVIVTPTGETQIQLSWTASVDPTVPGQNTSGVASYSIYRNNTLINTSATTAYLDTGLVGGTAYSYQISATDEAGNTSTKTVAIIGTTPTLSLQVQRRVVLLLEGAPATKRNVSGTVEFLNPTNSAKVYQASVTTDSFGRYTMSVPSGLIPTVNMRAVFPGYLAKKLNDIDLRNDTVLDLNFPQLPAGDFNDDQLINSLDFSFMNSKWGVADALADINRDGVVNTLDFSYLSNNWLIVGE